jgi:lincosamide nucleotidyltransferase A/C/D/E
MVSDQDAIRLYQDLVAQEIQVWIVGGWGIDALLGEQTRLHKDLDIIMLVDDVVRMREYLACDGYHLEMLWSENRWDVDADGVEVPTAFVLQDANGRQVDAHAMWLDDQGNGLPAWEAGDLSPEGRVLKPDHLGGEGTIAGVAVRCFSPEMQVLAHTGYDLPDRHRRDVQLLCERFALQLP